VSGAVRLLLIEDSETDAELLLYELQRYGYDAAHNRVDSEQALRSVLAHDRSWDLVLCDHGLPSFSSAEALQVVRDLAPEVPFVILSGTIGEEAAVEALKSGARDVVLKENLARLGPVVDRELRESANRRQREQLESDRAQLESQLIQSQKLDAIGQLAAGIAHDYRNLLGVVLGFSDLALKQVPEDNPAHAYITEIRTAGQHAVSLTDQLLTFSRSHEGAPELLNINTMLAELEPMLRHLLGGDVEFAVVPATDVAPVMIDPRRLEQVIINLAVNARDAMPNGGRFTLQTDELELAQPGLEQPARRGRYVVLTVRDSGVGIDEETRARLFEPFFTTKDPGRGTGLGLATSYGIVERAGGFITVESEPGQGAAFIVHLPRADRGAEPAAQPASQPDRPLAGTETVLLVEDNELLRRLLEEALLGSGYTVLSARDGVDALEQGERHEGSIDLLLTDVMMPGMRGTELIPRILRLRPELRVLIMSAQPAPAEVDGVDGFIAKPFTLSALAVRLREILEGSSSDS
jgi:two-component system cell cycle sensor histidine kinase/response regulator CckA